MGSVYTVSLCAIALAGIGSLVDITLKGGAKARIYDWAVGKWLALSEVRIGDLPARIARAADLPYRRILALGWWAWPVSALASFGLTGAAAVFGRWLRFGLGKMSHPTVVESVWHFGTMPSRYVPALLVNWTFDLLTIVVTFHILRLVAVSKYPSKRILLLLLNVGVAVGLAFACLFTAHVATTSVVGNTYANDLSAATTTLVHTWTLSVKPEEFSYVDDALFASTTLIPTICFTLVLAILIAAKLFIEAVLRVFLYYLELLAEPLPRDVREKVKPFTLAGAFLGIIGLCLKLAIDIARVAGH